MNAQLQDIIDLAAHLFFKYCQSIQVPWIQNQRLFANSISPNTQGKTHMSIMEIIRRAYGDIVQSLFITTAAQFFNVPVKTFEFREEGNVMREAVEYSNGIRFIDGRH